MKHNIFISYSNDDVAIVQNLQDKLKNFGVEPWVYSKNKTIGEDIWNEIENKIREADIVIFAVSENFPDSSGQMRELKLARELQGKFFPVFLTNEIPSNCPDVLRAINGDFLNVYNVETVAAKIAKHFFPSSVENKSKQPWNYPRPGSWLEISTLDGVIEQYFNVGDKLYFRAISPIGLFECYAPKTEGLFWIAPQNVRICLDVEKDEKLEESIPKKYTVMGMIDIQTRGWDSWHESHPNE